MYLYRAMSKHYAWSDVVVTQYQWHKYAYAVPSPPTSLVRSTGIMVGGILGI